MNIISFRAFLYTKANRLKIPTTACESEKIKTVGASHVLMTPVRRRIMLQLPNSALLGIKPGRDITSKFRRREQTYPNEMKSRPVKNRVVQS